MLAILETNNAFTHDNCSNDAIKMIKLFNDIYYKRNDKNIYNVLLKCTCKLISCSTIQQRFLFNIIKLYHHNSFISGIIIEQYAKIYGKITDEFMENFMHYVNPVRLSDSNEICDETVLNVHNVSTTYLPLVNKLIPDYINPSVNLLEMAARHKNIMMIVFLKNHGVHMTVKYLSHICSSLNINEIKKIVLMKILPDTECVINVIKNTDSIYNAKKAPDIISLFHMMGTKINDEMVSQSITSRFKLNLDELHVKYTFDMYLLELDKMSRLYEKYHVELDSDLRMYYKLYSSNSTTLKMITDVEKKHNFKPNHACFSLAMKFTHDSSDIVEYVIEKAHIDITFNVLRDYYKCNKFDHIRTIIDILDKKNN